MTDDRSLERAARSWIEAGPTRVPERAVERAILLIETTPQDRDLRIPRRFTEMTLSARVVAAAVIGVLVIGATFYMLRPNSANVATNPTTPPSAVPTASPSPPGPTLLSYKTARDAICTPAITQVTALNDQASNLHPATSAADRAALIANLTEVVAVGTAATDRLARLQPPAFMAADHAADVAHHRDSIAVLNEAITRLQAGKVADAMAMADATTPLSSVEEAFEQNYGLAGCP